jgi:solute carrier family 25 oxoglutarate transporter 11
VFDAFGRIIKEEGITSCWKGAGPTIIRAIAMNVAMLVTYDECREGLIKWMSKDANPRLIQFGASLMSAVATSIASLPFDNLKTKL